jgi:hypothetical protein
MSHDEQNIRSGDGLRELREGPLPPRSLEQSTVAALKARGLIAPSGHGRRAARAAAALAAGVLLFVAGYWLGGAIPEDNAGKSDGRTFALFLRQGAGHVEPTDAEERGRVVAEYSNWARSGPWSDAVLAGEKLAERGVLLVASNGSVSASEVERGGPGFIGGYFLVRADGPGEAEEIARSCPHLRRGGAIEIREIETR